MCDATGFSMGGVGPGSGKIEAARADPRSGELTLAAPLDPELRQKF
jgi:hypothetical protein